MALCNVLSRQGLLRYLGQPATFFADRHRILVHSDNLIRRLENDGAEGTSLLRTIP